VDLWINNEKTPYMGLPLKIISIYSGFFRFFLHGYVFIKSEKWVKLFHEKLSKFFE